MILNRRDLFVGLGSTALALGPGQLALAANGSGGTDHSTGGAAFVLGGSVRGGRMLGDWPTLAPTALFEGRDLAPVNDVRSLFASVLRDQWGLDAATVRAKVFPEKPPAQLFERLIV